MRILRLAAGDELQDGQLYITAEDVELSTRVVDISLHIKALARSSDSGGVASTDVAAEMPVPARQQACGDYNPQRFAQEFLSSR